VYSLVLDLPLSDEALARLRVAVGNLRTHEGGSLPHREIMALGASLGPNAQVTLDLRATETVGVPLLIVAAFPPGSNLLNLLSPRESEVANLIALGLTNKAIAHRLSLSPATVKDHVHHILQKTQLPNRAAIVAHRGSR
jgi:two-component system, NarL family, nitrate/nitrite response regulator NarL